jgi:hypothetical protein
VATTVGTLSLGESAGTVSVDVAAQGTVKTPFSDVFGGDCSDSGAVKVAAGRASSCTVTVYETAKAPVVLEGGKGAESRLVLTREQVDAARRRQVGWYVTRDSSSVR